LRFADRVTGSFTRPTLFDTHILNPKLAMLSEPVSDVFDHDPRTP
jgi:hypothetical protein